MDLHVALAVAVGRRALPCCRIDGSRGEQLFVKLRRRHRTDDSPRRGNRLTVPQPHAVRLSVGDENLGDIRAGAHLAALFADQRLKSCYGFRRTTLHDWCAGRLQCKGDNAGDLAGKRILRPEPGMQHPGGEESADEVRFVTRLQPGAAGAERLAEAGGKAARAAPPRFFQEQRPNAARPQRPAEQREKQGRIASTTPMSSRSRSPSPA